jgi:hypothetical protein
MHSGVLAAVCLLFFVLTLPGRESGHSTSPFGASGDNDPSFDGLGARPMRASPQSLCAIIFSAKNTRTRVEKGQYT